MRKTLAFTLAIVVVMAFSGCSWESSFSDAGGDGYDDGGDQPPGYPLGPYGIEYRNTVENFGIERVSCQGDRGTGRDWRLSEYLGSKAVLITVHTGWCPFCKQQSETMEEDTQRPYGDRGLDIMLLLSEDPNGSQDRETLLDYACYYRGRYGFSFPVGIDPGGAATGKYYDGVPLNMLLDENMVIRYKITGLLPGSDLQGNIGGLLDE